MHFADLLAAVRAFVRDFCDDFEAGKLNAEDHLF
jgi:hypothetical protein